MTETADERAMLRQLLERAVSAVSAETAMPRTLPLSQLGRTVVIAVGKGAADMMRVARQNSGGHPIEGLIVTREGHLLPQGCDWPGIRVIEAGHPYPNDKSIEAAEAALALARSLQAGDRMIVLLSGGGSALLAAPAAGVSLADKQEVSWSKCSTGTT